MKNYPQTQPMARFYVRRSKLSAQLDAILKAEAKALGL